MRKRKADQTVEEICMNYFVQYFERHHLSSSGWHRLWLSETSSLQFLKIERVCNMIWYRCSETNGFSFVARLKFEIDTIEIKIIKQKNAYVR